MDRCCALILTDLLELRNGCARRAHSRAEASGGTCRDCSKYAAVVTIAGPSRTGDRSSPSAALYLEQMIQHHEGAVDMATTEVDKGRNTDAVAMAQSIMSSQTEQIAQMQDVLASI